MTIAISPERKTDLTSLLRSLVDQAPDRMAVVAPAVQLTYAQLQDQARTLGQTLLEAGVKSGERVAVLLPNGCEFIISMFGIWSIEAIAVPLHVKFLEAELFRYLRDCNVRVLIADHRMGSIEAALQPQGLHLDQVLLSSRDDLEFRPQRSCGPGRAQSLGPNSATPALSQYSTGSSGEPKRITRTHAQLVNEARGISQTMGISHRDRILAAVPLFHCYGFCNAMLSVLASSGTVVTLEEFFPRDVIRTIEREKITGFPGVPFMYQLLTEFSGKADLSSLRYGLSAGAPLPVNVAEAFHRRFGVFASQLYGATEAGVVSVNVGFEAERYPESVGHPIPGVKVEIVDDMADPVASGTVGNIAITSEAAATAYDRHTGSGESIFQGGRFLPGDLGKILDNGKLIIEGRKRLFINVSGNKVSPAEVESAIKSHPLVVDAAVVGVADGLGAEKVKAVIVPSGPCDRAQILDHCRGLLAEYKLPRIIEFRPEIPKSPLGKVLRKYLIDDSEGE